MHQDLTRMAVAQMRQDILQNDDIHIHLMHRLNIGRLTRKPWENPPVMTDQGRDNINTMIGYSAARDRITMRDPLKISTSHVSHGPQSFIRLPL
ncbi:MAG: hypothetical protein EOP85_01830 [Verrucomicrobiaceae bacterium]|nr:MAG: hypothetical protein EOP85_01830 [Verrucomicrobiaceae bacterium]